MSGTGPLPASAEPPTEPNPTRDSLERQIMELKIEQLRAESKHLHDHVTDHDTRVRSLETIGTRFTTLYAMFAGNGLMSVIILIKLFADAP